MRVVVTRPESSARRTAERLQNLGHQPVLLPLTKAV
ncbi:uroporphyrinogen-III synthase, partial [Neorhizobium sp. BETTINA12A]|nr:uroporphyrinogen-III synthase [Neorhizobium sp. BETTINA12A]